jgi:thiol:disulfide interchange protein
MKHLLIVALAVCVVLPAVGDEKKTADVKNDATKTTSAFKQLDFDKAVALAKKEKKIVMIDFYTDWCGWCKELDKKTWSDAKVQKLLSDKTISIKLNAEKEGSKAAARYKVNAFPTIVFVDGDGKEVGKLIGYRPPDKFMTDVAKYLK